MNRDQTHQPTGDESVPDDLRDMQAVLSALAAQDRAAGDVDLEHRVWGGSLGDLHAVAPVQAAASRAGSIDRNAASPALESHVFDVSKRELARRHEPVPARIGAGRDSHARVWVRRLSIAAAIAVVATIGVYLGRGTPVGTPKPVEVASTGVRGMSTAALRESLAHDFDLLLTAVGDAGTSESTASDAGFQAEWLDELVEEGRAS